MRLFRRLILIAAVLLVAKPAAASPITVLVGDKDWFGVPAQSGGVVPWTGNPSDGVFDNRDSWIGSAVEKNATNGAQLTDLYSALFFDYPCDPAGDSGCSPNKDTGSVFFPFVGTLQSATITMRMGDFECAQWGAMTVDINGVNVPFCFNDGLKGVATRSFGLTSSMIDAANLVGEVRLNFDHRGAYDVVDAFGNVITPGYGSLDYIAFDYFQLDAEVAPVPEPATFVLIGLGLAGLAARRRLRGRL